jgi:hypothetical protein
VLTLQKCRSLIGTDCKLTHAELEQLRQEMYAYADVAIESLCASRKPGACPTGESCLEAIPIEEREAVAERAAILEYEGNLTKPEAERQAFGEWVRAKNLPGRKSKKKINRRKSGKPRKLDISPVI